MELLAILSTIILVGTVATLILAVAAYVLYKIRERKRERLETRLAAGHYAATNGRPAVYTPPHGRALDTRPAPYAPAAAVGPSAAVDAPARPPAGTFWEYSPDGSRPVRGSAPDEREAAPPDGGSWL
jgi:hypothetical protein